MNNISKTDIKQENIDKANDKTFKILIFEKGYIIIKFVELLKDSFEIKISKKH